jgi:hypothetical protein
MTWDNDKFSDYRERIRSDEEGWSGGSGRRSGFWIRRLALVSAVVVLVGLWLLLHSWDVV